MLSTSAFNQCPSARASPSSFCLLASQECTVLKTKVAVHETNKGRDKTYAPTWYVSYTLGGAARVGWVCAGEVRGATCAPLPASLEAEHDGDVPLYDDKDRVSVETFLDRTPASGCSQRYNPLPKGATAQCWADPDFDGGEDDELHVMWQRPARAKLILRNT